MIVHVVTRKGMGYAPAEDDEAEQMHSTVPIDPATGQVDQGGRPGLDGDVFSDALIGYAKKRRDIVAITAAMPGPDRADARSGSGSPTGCSTSASPSSTR